MLACLAARFQLRQDHEDQDVDGSIRSGIVGGGGGNVGDGGDGAGVVHLGAGVTWVPGDHGSDGRG
jgi:hypothetical protein